VGYLFVFRGEYYSVPCNILIVFFSVSRNPPFQVIRHAYVPFFRKIVYDVLRLEPRVIPFLVEESFTLLTVSLPS